MDRRKTRTGPLSSTIPTVTATKAHTSGRCSRSSALLALLVGICQGREEEAQHEEELDEELVDQDTEDGVTEGKEDGGDQGEEAEERPWAAAEGEREGGEVG